MADRYTRLDQFIHSTWHFYFLRLKVSTLLVSVVIFFLLELTSYLLISIFIYTNSCLH